MKDHTQHHLTLLIMSEIPQHTTNDADIISLRDSYDYRPFRLALNTHFTRQRQLMLMHLSKVSTEVEMRSSHYTSRFCALKLMTQELLYSLSNVALLAPVNVYDNARNRMFFSTIDIPSTNKSR